MHKSNQTTRTEHEDSKNSDASMSGLFHGLMAFERDILTILAGCDAPAGVDVRAELTAYYETRVEESRIYQALTNLADQGFVEISAQNGRTNAYQLTTLGRRILADGRELKAMVRGEVVD